MPGWLETAAHVGAFLGVLILSVPVLSLDWRKMQLERIRKIVAGTGAGTGEAGKAEGFDRIAAEVKDGREAAATRWRPVDRVCLYAGYALVFLSSIARIFAG